MRVRRAGGCALALSALLLSACSGAAPGPASSARVGPAVGNVLPSVAGTSLQGHHVDAAAWRGSVGVLLFWASWCEPCQAEQPAMNALAASEMPAGVHFAGISVDADPAAARRYLATYRVPYDSLIDDPQSQALTLAFEVSGPPETFVIDSKGRVANRIVGPVSADELRADITAAARR